MLVRKSVSPLPGQEHENVERRWISAECVDGNDGCGNEDVFKFQVSGLHRTVKIHSIRWKFSIVKSRLIQLDENSVF